MISNSIQELFDGTLGDEQTAELLHSLSVSPERRTDFRRHMALQGAMQRDRAANELTPDEDRAVWGVLAGLGGAATIGGAAANYTGGIARMLGVLAIGIGGYLVGSFTDLAGTHDSAATAPPVAAVSKPAAPQNGSPSRPDAPVSSPARTAAPGSAATPAQQSLAATAAPTVVYKDRIVYRDKIVYRDRPVDLQARNGSGVSNISRTAPVPDLATSARSFTLANDSGISERTRNESANGIDPKRIEPAQMRPIDSASKPANLRDEHASIKPIDPVEAFRQTDDDASKDKAAPVSVLWANGFEFAYGEYAGVLSGDLVADDMVKHDPYYFSRHFDITYRMADGRFGLGARIGTGTFSRASFYLDFNVRVTTRNGNVNRIDSMYRVRVGPEKQTLTEFFANYRFPVTDNLGVGVEASWGRSPVHTKAGGSAIVHWLLTDRIGLLGGIGLNRYWYSYIAEQRDAILRSGGEGTSISDKAANSYTGTSFEGRYGLFYHF